MDKWVRSLLIWYPLTERATSRAKSRKIKCWFWFLYNLTSPFWYPWLPRQPNGSLTQSFADPFVKFVSGWWGWNMWLYLFIKSKTVGRNVTKSAERPLTEATWYCNASSNHWWIRPFGMTSFIRFIDDQMGRQRTFLFGSNKRNLCHWLNRTKA